MWRKRLELESDRKRFIKDVEASRQRTMQRAVRLLAAKPRPVEELRERLLEKAWTDETSVNSVIEKLTEYGYLDDEKYAGDLALSKLRQRPQGRRRLRQALSQKKLSREHVEAAIGAAFDAIPESELIEKAVEKWVGVKGIPETRVEQKKLYEHLMRRGFDHDLIRTALAELVERSRNKDH